MKKTLIWHKRLALSAVVLVLATVCFAETAHIKIYFREAEEALPFVETLLSPEGSAVVDKTSNAIIVRDDSETIEKIQQMIKQIDTEPEQVRIRVRFEEEGVSNQSDLSGDISHSEYSTPSERRVSSTRGSLNVTERSINARESVESFITVSSGSSAYINVGKDIPYTQRWIDYSRNYAHVVEEIVWQRVDTGFEVKPTVTEKAVILEIIPRVSSESEGPDSVIRFTEAATRLTVARGQWVSIGGNSRNSNEVVSDILSKGTDKRKRNIGLYLFVE
jgi:type II secretory pathway component HofQ